MTRLPLLVALAAASLARSPLGACDFDTSHMDHAHGFALKNPPPALPVPPEVLKIAEEYDKEAQAIHAAADEKLDSLRAKTVRKMRPLQDKYTREAKLDEALAIRSQIHRIRGIRPDPGMLRADPGSVGKSFFFEVVGSTAGAVWGTEVYTTDSNLATAAVHSGALKPGEKGVVKAVILPGRSSYEPSTRNGVASQAWGEWGVSFRVQKAEE